MEGSLCIDLSGADRVTWSTNDVVNNGFTNVRRSRTYVWSADSSKTSNLVSIVESAADGLRMLQVTSWNPAGEI